MGKARKKEVYVIGHKNPDTDCVCASIAYAYLKNEILRLVKEGSEDEVFYTFGMMDLGNTNLAYVPRIAGQLTSETQFVLKKFGMSPPRYLNDARTQVRDINFRRLDGVDRNISMKQAWTHMGKNNTATLAVANESGRLEGIITTGNIATSYMDVFDNRVLADSATPYKNVIDAVDGVLVTGDENDVVSSKGHIFINTANLDLMRRYVQEGDVVILGNRYEAQLCAIEMNVDCIIVGEGALVSKTIKKLANDKGCKVISTPHDVYTVARLISQSVPIGYFMQKEGLISFNENDFIIDIKGIMMNKRHRDFPILNRKKEVVGLISRRMLINMDKKQLILIDHNEAEQAVDGLEDAEVVEIIDHHKLATVETIKPVMVRNQPVGCTSTIVYQMFEECGIEIPKNMAGMLCAAIISDTLHYHSPTCTWEDKAAAQALAGIANLDTEAFAKEMFHSGSNLAQKTEDEIFYQDFKKFTVNGATFGVSQIMSMNGDELEEVRTRMLPFMEQVCEKQGIHMVYVMLTNILDESTLLLFAGNESREIAETSFNQTAKEHSIFLPGVVSRKKQLIPDIMATLQQ